MNCPKCDKEMDHEDDDPSVGIAGGWFCDSCDLFIHDSEADYSDDYLEPDRA